MSLTQFADAHRLKLTKDICGDQIIAGRIFESNIYEYNGDMLGVIFVTDGRKAPRTGLWNNFKAKALASGMTLGQEGDAEGSFKFDPIDRQQSKVAISGIRARAKRVVTPEQAKAGAERLAAAREARNSVPKPHVEGLISTPEREKSNGMRNYTP